MWIVFVSLVRYISIKLKARTQTITSLSVVFIIIELDSIHGVKII